MRLPCREAPPLWAASFNPKKTTHLNFRPAFSHGPPQLWVLGRKFIRNTSKNLTKRTILFLRKGDTLYRFVAGSIGLDRDLTISGQRIPPCLPAPVPTEGGAGRYKIFSGIPDEF